MNIFHVVSNIYNSEFMCIQEIFIEEYVSMMKNKSKIIVIPNAHTPNKFQITKEIRL
jgi:hypothetical protein